MWIALAVLAVVSLIWFWRGRNAVWGGLIVGSLSGVGVAAVYPGFQWLIVGRWTVALVLVGAVLEVASRLHRGR